MNHHTYDCFSINLPYREDFNSNNFSRDGFSSKGLGDFAYSGDGLNPPNHTNVFPAFGSLGGWLRQLDKAIKWIDAGFKK